MSTRIILSDTHATTVREVVEKTIPLEAFLEQCQQSSCLMTGILPVGTKMISFNSRQIGLVIECPPAIRHFTYEIKTSSRPNRVFQLFFPWTYFIVSCEANPNRINHISWFFSRKPISGKDSIIGHMAMPNTSIERNGLGNICLGSVHVDDNDAYEIGALIDQFITCIWGSAFNSDLFQPNDTYGIPSFRNRANRAIVEDRLKLLDKIKNKVEHKYLTLVLDNELQDIMYLLAWENDSLALNLPAKTMFLDDPKFKFPVEEKLSERVIRSSNFKDMDWV